MAKKKRNPIAQILKYFTPKRFKDKTKYNRKLKHGKHGKRPWGRDFNLKRRSNKWKYVL